MKKTKESANCRLGKVGGEAVLEGVMMRAGTHCATACRAPDGEIAVVETEYVSLRKKNKFFNVPIIRGVVSFVESMKVSMNTLNVSAEVMGIDEEEEESRFEKWLKKTFGKSIYDMIMGIGIVLGLALAVGIFFFLPNLIANGIESLAKLANPDFDLGVWKAAIASVVKMLLFVIYISLVTLMPDIRRTFQYHGAEHKSIACYEAGEELTPENAKKHTRFHPRCGTSFMFVMILLGLFISVGIRILFEVGLQIDFAAITGKNLYEALIYTGIGILTLPFVMGIGFEFLMLAGKHPNAFTRALSAPGLWMQRLTTKEPSLKQLECAIVAIKCALKEEFPDFDKSAYIIKGNKIRAMNSGSAAEEKKAPVTEAAEAPVTEGEEVPVTEAAEAPVTESAPQNDAN